MSIITDFLKLFKYDPETDGASTFNIKQCLNDNWDKIDAWASGIKTTIAGLVPGTRKVNGKELSADVTLTGEDIKTSASDETTISSQLSKKAMSSFGVLTASDLLVWAQQQNVGGSFFIDPPVTTSGLPDIPDKYFVGTLEIGQLADRKITITNNGMRTFVNKSMLKSGESAMSWIGWKEIPTATPPQVRNLTLQSGFTANGDCTFFVTQESAVFLAGGVSGTLPANQDTQIGTLPTDASPSSQRRRPAMTNVGAAYIDIHTDGTVWAHPFAAASQCWFDTSFVAGGS